MVCVDSSVTKCDLLTNTVCHTEYSQQCKDHVKLELEPYIETFCETKYQEECEHRWEGEGNEKVGRLRIHSHTICDDVFLVRSGSRFLAHADRSRMRSARTWPRLRRGR